MVGEDVGVQVEDLRLVVGGVRGVAVVRPGGGLVGMRGRCVGHTATLGRPRPAEAAPPGFGKKVGAGRAGRACGEAGPLR